MVEVKTDYGNKYYAITTPIHDMCKHNYRHYNYSRLLI